MTRFTKLDIEGQPLPVEATDWCAVLDTTTQLIWSAQNVGDGRMNWADAKAACTSLDLCGCTDWQLPTVEQLFALADRTRFNPAIDTDFFPDTESSWYWSSTPVASAPRGYAWFVLFYGGASGWVYQYYGAFVRAVRSASASQS